MNTAYLVAGLAFGDEGKGATVDFLCRQRQADLVVRYNGGAQAAHNVITPDGRHHTFSQFGSGSFIPGVRTHLSRFMMVNPLNMMNEEEHLREVGVPDAWERLTVEDKALIITPYHKAVNRMLEAWRGDNKHGSCGQGIGITRQLHIDHGDKVLFAGDFTSPGKVFDKLAFIREQCLTLIQDISPFVSDSLNYMPGITELMRWYRPWIDVVKVVGQDHLAKLLEISKASVFEGAQGVLLDEVHGTAPYNTWTDTTFHNAQILSRESQFGGSVVKVGVMRNYLTRHGAGPFPTEMASMHWRPESHNTTGLYQGKFRIGYMDYDLIRRSLNILGGVDYLALNHLDVSGVRAKDVAAILHTPVGIRSYGPTADDRQLDI